MTFLKRHKLTVSLPNGNTTGSTTTAHTFWFLAPANNYTDANLTASITGVSKIEDNATGVDSYAPVCTVEALLRSGVAVRRIISYKVGTRRRRTEILVAKDLADTFVAPANFKGDPNPQVIEPLRSSYS